MRRILILLSFAIVSLLSSCSKTDNDITIRDMVFGETDMRLVQAKNYKGFPANLRQSVLWEPFIENVHQWTEVSNNNMNYFKVIEGGMYHIMGYSGSGVTNNGSSNTLPLISNSNNFEIEISFRIVQKGSRSLNYLLTFGDSSGDYKDRIEIMDYPDASGNSSHSNFSISNFPSNDDNRNRYFDTNVKYNSPIGFDIITIRKVNSSWIIFFNGLYIKQLVSLRIATSWINFYTSKEAQIDYIKYDYLLN